MRAIASGCIIPALIAAGLVSLIPSAASADTSGGQGRYLLSVHTCNQSNAQTGDPVWITVQSGGQLSKWQLNNPGSDRALNQTDYYRFEWPAELPGPSQLEQIKLQKTGVDGWCFDSVELRYGAEQTTPTLLWRWLSSDDNRNRKMVVGWPGQGPISLDILSDSDAASYDPVAHVRFSDKVISLGADEARGAASNWQRFFTTTTCATGTDVGTSSAVQLQVMHDGVGDVHDIPGGTFAQARSTWTIGTGALERQSANYRELDWMRKLDQVVVRKAGGDDWCMEKVALQYYNDAPNGSVPTYWASPRQMFGSGDVSKPFTANATVAPSCAQGCTTLRQGFPLQSSASFNRTLAVCAGNREVCNGKDDNCDGVVDLDADPSLINACGTCGPVPVEECNGRDDDCDGLVDDEYVCTPITAAVSLPAAEYVPNRATASSTRWPIANAYDRNFSTSWSSATTAQSIGQQWVSFGWSQGRQKINYVKVTPRRVNGKVVAFPDLENQSGSVSVSWKDSGMGMSDFLDVPAYNDAYVFEGGSYTIRFAYPVYADAIKLSASPEKDENGVYALEIVEISAGYSGDEPTTGVPSLGPAALVGSILATGDFNADGVGDIAVGSPWQQVGKEVLAGAVHVYYGSAEGLGKAQVFTQDSPGILDSAAPFDAFGSVLATGDFNGDGASDLAIGAGANQVQILYGSPQVGLSAAGNQLIMQGTFGIIGLPESGDQFGAALATGDFNKDGNDDLVIGIPGEDLPERSKELDAGAVAVIFGSRTGLTGYDQLWTQLGDIQDEPEQNDAFGSSLAVGDFNKDGRADLAVGAPGEAVGSLAYAGAVNVLYGTTKPDQTTALDTPNNQIWSQDWPAEVPDASAAYEQFGSVLVSGDFNGDGYADLSIGVPAQDVGGKTRAGAVHILYGSTQRLALTGTQFITKDPAEYDYLGNWMTKGNFNGDQRTVAGSTFPVDDLVLGVPLRKVGDISPGFVYVMYGSAGGVSVAGQTWSLSSPDVDTSGAPGNDAFGVGLASVDLNERVKGYPSTSELIVGAPYRQEPSFEGAGTFTVLPGVSGRGLTGAGSRTIHFDPCAYWSEPQDCFDFDHDNAPIGLERLAGILKPGQTDFGGSIDSDEDGIPDGIEIRGYTPNTGLDLRSSPVATAERPVSKDIYVVLPHSPLLTDQDRAEISRHVARYFARGTSKFKVSVIPSPVAEGEVANFHASCAATQDSEERAPWEQEGWYSGSKDEVNLQVSRQLAGDLEVVLTSPYAHVGRVCLDLPSGSAPRGAIQYRGGWQFMVRMPPPPSDDANRGLWRRALSSLIAHELGHSLGLRHGGDTDQDCSLLYPSVMNHGYDFQLSDECSDIGFSTGALAVETVSQRLQIWAGDGVTTFGTSEFDVLNGRFVNDENVLRPMSAGDLNFLSCWARHDTGIARPSLDTCPNDTNKWCANWDADGNQGDTQYCLSSTGYYPPDPRDWSCYEGDSLGFAASDPPYVASDIFGARTGQGFGFENIISGCAPYDLGATNENPYPLPEGCSDPAQCPMKDHDDFTVMEKNLQSSLSREPKTCGGLGDCTRVIEPLTLGQVDDFSGRW